MRRVVKSLALALGLSTIAIVLLIATSGGQRLLLAGGAWVASSAESGVQVGTLSGSLFGKGELSEFALRDDQGPWLVARNIAFDWSPEALASGRLDVAALSIESVDVLRKPQPTTAPVQKSMNASLKDALPPVGIRVEVLNIDRIAIAEAVAGQSAHLAIAASIAAVDPKQNLSAHLDLKRLDGAGGDLRVAASFKPAANSLNIDVKGQEPAGGLVATLLELPDRPALSVTVAGNGPLDAWAAELAMRANGQTFIAGSTRLTRTGDNAHALAAKLTGFLEHVVPDAAASLFTGQTAVSVDATIAGLDGASDVAVPDARFSVATTEMAINGQGGFDAGKGANGKGLFGQVSGQIGKSDQTGVRVGGDEGVAFRKVAFAAVFEALTGNTAPRAEASALIEHMSAGDAVIERTTLAMTARRAPAASMVGNLENLNATLDITGARVTGIDEHPLIDATIALQGSLSDGRLAAKSLSLRAPGVSAAASGTIDARSAALDGKLTLADLGALAAAFGQKAQGHGQSAFQLNADFERGTATAHIDGETENVALAETALAHLFVPKTQFSGRVETAREGQVRISDARIENTHIAVEADGAIGGAAPTVSARLRVSDLAVIDPKVSGAITGDVELSGDRDHLTSSLAIESAAIRVRDQTFAAPRLRFAGKGPMSNHVGALSLTGKLGDAPIEGSANIAASDTGAFVAEKISLIAAGNSLTGDVRVVPDQPPAGAFAVHANKLAAFSAAAGMPIAGGITATGRLGAADGIARAELEAQSNGLRFGKSGLKRLRVTGAFTDYLTAPKGEAKATVSGVQAGTTVIDSITVSAKGENAIVSLIADAKAQAQALTLRARVAPRDDGLTMSIDRLAVTGHGESVSLASPVDIVYAGDVLKVPPMTLRAGGGQVTARGTLTPKRLDAQVELSGVSAAVSRIVDPQSDFEGVFNGTAKIAGMADKPVIEARLTGSSLTTRAVRQTGLPPVNLNADVRQEKDVVRLNATVAGRDQLSLKAAGTVKLAGAGAFNIDASGQLPLALANVFLTDRGTRVLGSADVAAAVRGTLKAPDVSGRLSIANAEIHDGGSGTVLKNIAVKARLQNDTVTLDDWRAVSSKGGSLQGSGRAELSSGQLRHVDLATTISAFKFGNQNPVAGEIDGTVNVSGPAERLVARGNLRIVRMDVTVPNQMPESVDRLDIRHVNRQNVSRQDGNRVGGKAVVTGSTTPAAAAPPVAVALNLQISSPDRIFVRGRGLDVVLGGQVRVGGLASRPSTDGKFAISRGRLSILGRQLEFSRGNILFVGTGEPVLDMEASADADGTKVTVHVTGPASKPKFSFSSVPDLPEDEVVALLLFNKKLTKLSPAQLVQLAGEIDKIGGLSSGPSTFDQLKGAMGIDVLDVSTDAAGDPTVSAGSYINDKTYVGVSQGTDLSKSRVVIDHALTDNIKARGEVGSQGQSKVGVGVEWDY